MINSFYLLLVYLLSGVKIKIDMPQIMFYRETWNSKQAVLVFSQQCKCANKSKGEECTQMFADQF